MAELDDDLVVHPHRDIPPVSLDHGRLNKPTEYTPIEGREFLNALQDEQATINVKSKQNKIKNICVYCGSSPGKDPVYVEAAKKLGARMAEEGVGLVYGGGGIGIMGTIARAVLQGGGKVTGIIPDFLLLKEGDFREVTEQHVVPDMHKRKMMMFERADAFVAMPGGVGTLEELIEMMTWAQLGRHGKPIIIANINNFWAPLLTLLDHMKAQGFIRPDMQVPYMVVDKVEDIMKTICAECFPDKPADPIKEAQVKKRF